MQPVGQLELVSTPRQLQMLSKGFSVMHTVGEGKRTGESLCV